MNPQELEIIQWGIQNGKSKEETKEAIVRFRLTGSPQDPAKRETEEPSFLERAGGRIVEGGKGFVEAIKGEGEFEGQSSVRRGFEAVSELTGIVPGVAVEVLPEPARDVLGKAGEVYKNVIDFLGEKIGSTDVAVNFVTEHPEAAKALEEIVGTAEAAGQISGDILLAEGGVRGARKAPKVIKAVAKPIANQTKKLLGGITETGTAGIKKAVSNALDPSNIMQRVARISKGKQAKFKQVAGESIGDYLVSRGIYGNIDELTTQLFNRFKTSKKSADTALAKLEGTFQPKPVRTALTELLEREVRVSTPGAVSKSFERVRELQNKFNREGLTMSEMNEVKRLYESNIKLDFLKQNLPESVERANNLDAAMRRWQFEQAEKLGLKNLPDINKETRLAKQLLDELGKEYAGSAGNNAITLTDWVVLAGGDPTAVGTFLAKKAVSSKKVQSSIAKKLAPEPTVDLPRAIFGEPTVDGYIEFLRRHQL